MAEGVLPVITVISPSNPVAGAQVRVTVTTEAIKTGERVLSISQSPAGFFSSVPSNISVPENQDRVEFDATIATTSSGQGSLIASCNGVSAIGICTASTP